MPDPWGNPTRNRDRPPGDEDDEEDNDLQDRDQAWPFGDPQPDFIHEWLLGDEVRAQMVQILREEPGLNKERLYRRVDANRDTARNQLELLVEGGIVVTRTEREREEVHCFVVIDSALWSNHRTRVLFGRPENRDVALYVAENPGATTQEIGDALDKTPRTIRHHLGPLRARGLIDQFQIGRKVFYGPRGLLEEWAHDVGEHFDRPWEE